MRKKIKNTLNKIIAIAFALMMTLGLSATAFAADPTGTITVTGPNKDDMAGKSFVAYQIFKLTTDGTNYSYSETHADVTKAVNAALKKVDSGYVGTTAADAVDKLDAIKKDDETNKNDTGVRTFTDALKAEIATVTPGSLTEYPLTISEATATATDLPYGYYIVLETTANTGKYNGAISLAMIDSVSPNWNQNVKSDYPTVEKKVAKNEDRAKYGDVADYDINDHVPFKVTGTMTKMDGYKTYKYEFYDKMEKGLTFEPGSVKVYLANGEANVKDLVMGRDYIIVRPAGEDTFAVKIMDLKALAAGVTADHVVVEFTSILNEEANIGSLGNQNDVYLRFSNNPYDEHSGKPEETTGKSKVDSVKVFTFEMKMDKYKKDAPGTKLAGAEFELYQYGPDEKDSSKLVKKQVNFKTVDGKDGFFVDQAGLIKTITTDSKGYFNVKGLDAGTYYLKEINAPAGYNKLNEDITFVIDATYSDPEESLTLETLKLTIDGKEASGKGPDKTLDYVNMVTGTVTIPVLNATGTILPSTGGMGTTVLYVVGILAMAGGLFYFVMSRKNNKNNKNK